MYFFVVCFLTHITATYSNKYGALQQSCTQYYQYQYQFHEATQIKTFLTNFHSTRFLRRSHRIEYSSVLSISHYAFLVVT